MAYTDIEIYTRDIDWFIYDSSNIHIHVASAGGILPYMIRINDEQNEQNLELTNSLQEIYSEKEIEINPNIIELAQIKEQDLQFYLRDFISMAKKRFYSFDKTNIGNPEDTFYHLVAKPMGYCRKENGLFSPEFSIGDNLHEYIDIWQPFDLISIIDKASQL